MQQLASLSVDELFRKHPYRLEIWCSIIFRLFLSLMVVFNDLSGFDSRLRTVKNSNLQIII